MARRVKTGSDRRRRPDHRLDPDGHSVPELLAQASKMAIEDAGLSKKDIDDIVTTQVAGFGSDPRLQYRLAKRMGFGSYAKVIDLPHTGGMSSGYATIRRAGIFSRAFATT